MNATNQTPATTTLVFETSHTAGDRSKRDHITTIAQEAGMTRTEAYRNNETGTDHATWTLEVPADQADDTGRSIAQDLTANGIRTTWYDASEPGPDPNQTYRPGDRVTYHGDPNPDTDTDTYEVEKVAHRKPSGYEFYQIRNTRTGERHTAHEDELDRADHATYTPATPTETPEAAAARFWRETSEAKGGGTPEFDPSEVEAWLDKNAPTGDHRRQTRAAIFEAAELMYLTRTDLAAAEEARYKAEQEAHHAKEDSEAAQERIEELEDALQKEEEAHQETKEAAEEARTNPDTGNTWEEDLREAQETLVETEEERRKQEEAYNTEKAAHMETKEKLQEAEKRAEKAEERAKRLENELKATIDAHSEKPENPNSRDWTILQALLTADPTGHTAEEKALLDLIDMTEEMADDGTPNGRDAWAGPTADDAYPKKTTTNE